MLYALIWLLVFSLLALWSLVSWGFHALAAWIIARPGGLSADAGEIRSWGLPDGLAPWIPSELASALPAMVSAVTPAVNFVLGLAPELAAVLSIGVWVVWTLGSVLLIVLGIVLSGAIAVLRKRRLEKLRQSMATYSYG